MKKRISTLIAIVVFLGGVVGAGILTKLLIESCLTSAKADPSYTVTIGFGYLFIGALVFTALFFISLLIATIILRVSNAKEY